MARLILRTASRTTGDFARIPATKTVPIAASANDRPPTSLAIDLDMTT